MTPRRIRIKNWLALCFCQLERRPVSILAVNYLNPQGELFDEDKNLKNCLNALSMRTCEDVGSTLLTRREQTRSPCTYTRWR